MADTDVNTTTLGKSWDWWQEAPGQALTRWKESGTNYNAGVTEDQLGYEDKIAKVQEQLTKQSQLYKTNMVNKAGDTGDNTTRLAATLASQGFYDVTKLRVTQDGKSYKLVDTTTGKSKKIDNLNDAFQSAGGDGYTRFGIKVDSKGRPVFTQSWESSNDAGPVAALAGLALNFLAPGAGSAIGSALGLGGTAATAVGSGILQSGLAAVGGARGSDIFKAGLAGAVPGALSSIPGFGSLATPIKGAITGGTQSLIRNGNLNGALAGAITGSIPGNVTGNSTADKLLRVIIGEAVKRKTAKP